MWIDRSRENVRLPVVVSSSAGRIGSELGCDPAR